MHSTVQGVSAERAWRDPAEMIVISYSTNVPSGYDRVYSIRINELEYAIRDGNFNSNPLRVFMIHPIMNHAILSMPESE